MDVIAKIREDQPFIFNITNEVASNFAANGLIAIGASPAMSHTLRESKDYGKIADAVVLNNGTLTESCGEAMLKAGKAANENGVPAILGTGGMATTSGIFLEDQQDKNDLMYIVNAVLEVIY